MPGAEASMFRPTPTECKKAGTHELKKRHWPYTGLRCPNCGGKS